MPEPLAVLVDQNVPRSIATWLEVQRPGWHVEHVSAVGLSGAPDEDIFERAQERDAIILTFDEDVEEEHLRGALVIVGRSTIRVRRP